MHTFATALLPPTPPPLVHSSPTPVYGTKLQSCPRPYDSALPGHLSPHMLPLTPHPWFSSTQTDPSFFANMPCSCLLGSFPLCHCPSQLILFFLVQVQYLTQVLFQQASLPAKLHKALPFRSLLLPFGFFYYLFLYLFYCPK